ncbi:MAG TPA: hypothetical protein VFI29_15795, partial [Hanamia sp.]|nr:hypothetical protein [Hanamia sp.]
MFSSVTRKLILLLLMAFFAFSVNAQKAHFIYLQTEGGRPFYAKFNNKLISSSSEGYIIIPGVTDGEYNLVVGFPRNEFPEEDYKIVVDNNNEGYLLKNFGEKGWQLFNMQTLALITGTSSKPNPVVVKKDENPFTKMLAGVVKDSSILQDHEAIAVAPAKKADTANNVNGDTSIATANESQHGSKISAPLSASDSGKVKIKTSSSVTIVTPPSVNKQDSIIRILDKSDKDGLQMIYEVKSDNSKTDTVRIYMPAKKNQADSSNVKS